MILRATVRAPISTPDHGTGAARGRENGVIAALAAVATLLAGAARGSESDVPTILVTDKAEQSARLEAAKLPVPSNELPISTELLDRSRIEQTGYVKLSDLLEVATSAINVSSEGGIFNDVMLRGFASTPFYRNGLSDSLGQLAPRSLANIERVEILKGPNAALLGPGEPGGSINYVTKRPQKETAATVSAELGHFDAAVLTLDATGALARHSDWQYRVVALREQGDTFRDFVKDDRWLLAPSVAWQPGPTTDIVASLELVRDRRLLDSGIALLNGLGALPRGRFLGEPSAGTAEIDGLTAQLAATTQLRGDWELDVSMQAQSTRVDGLTAEPSEFDGVSLLREAHNRNEENDAWVVQLETAGPVGVWNQRHDMLFGIEGTALNEDVTLLGSDSDLDPFTIDPFAPIYGQAFPALLPERQSTEQRRQISVYAQDLWRLSAHWRLLLGARFDYIDQSGSDRTTRTRFDNARGRVSPRLSLLYLHPLGFTWYASYSESLDPNEGLKPDGSALSPTLGKAVETGLRWESPRRVLAFDVAVFGIRQTDVTVEAPGNPGFEIQTGRQQNAGVDVEMRFAPTPASMLQLHYDFLDSEISNDPSIPDGTAALNAPRHHAGILALHTTSLRRPGDFGLGIAVIYVGERQASLEPGELALRLGDYVRADLFGQWALSRHVEFNIRFQNLTGASYIQGSQSDALRLSPGAPFEVRAEIALRF